VPDLSDVETVRYVQAEAIRWKKAVTEYGISVD